MNLVLFLEIIALVALCTYSDIITHKIPNKYTCISIIAGIATNVAVFGCPGLFNSLKGIVLAFVLLIVPYIIGGIGGGDVKMLIAEGAIGGAGFVVKTMIFSSFAGAVIALCLLIHEKRLKTGLANVTRYLCNMFLVRQITAIDQPVRGKCRFPFGVAICAGTLMTFAFNMFFGNPVI